MTEALVARLREREQDLIRACDLANQDQDAAEIEREFEEMRDEIGEPWR
ncbi:MAG: hypothetical protein NTV70_02390 [Acidobacteria bacterium]|nr:hypothetical protein [Acidobacteriota bacterium]